MIRVIIFDWHGVLDEVRLEQLVKKLVLLSRHSLEEVKEIIRPIERLYALGAMEPDLFWHKIQQAFMLDITQLQQAKSSILVVKKNQPLWERIDQLRKLYTFAILSDCPLDKIAKIRAEVNLRDFAIAHFSAKEHLTKDTPAFFLSLANQLHVSPSECLYVDDTMRHINTAALLGFQTCFYTTVEDLNNALKKQLIRQ